MVRPPSATAPSEEEQPMGTRPVPCTPLIRRRSRRKRPPACAPRAPPARAPPRGRNKSAKKKEARRAKGASVERQMDLHDIVSAAVQADPDLLPPEQSSPEVQRLSRVVEEQGGSPNGSFNAGGIVDLASISLKGKQKGKKQTLEVAIHKDRKKPAEGQSVLDTVAARDNDGNLLEENDDDGDGSGGPMGGSEKDFAGLDEMLDGMGDDAGPGWMEDMAEPGLDERLDMAEAGEPWAARPAGAACCASAAGGDGAPEPPESSPARNGSSP